MATTTTVYRGETIALLHIAQGDVMNILGMEATLKRATSTDPTAFPQGQPVVATMAFAAVPDMSTSTRLAWYVGLTATQCLALEPGLYATQVRTTMVDGTVEQGDMRFIRIIEPVEPN